MNFDYPPGATPLSYEELQELIPSHIETQEELNAWEEKNIIEAQSWAFKQKNILSEEFIKKLHKHMFNKTWKWAGRFRQTGKNIGISWASISMSIRELCEDVRYQLDHHVFSKDEIVIRFHHRLVWIHPFPNGNGRLARLMADLLITRQGGIRFSWGMHQNLYKQTSTRKLYIEALQKADRGDYSDLLSFSRS